MDCRQAEIENIVGQYLSGGLAPARMQEFEEHYFECDACAQRLDDWRQIELVLRQDRNRLLAQASSRAWIYTAAAIAAMASIGFTARRPARSITEMPAAPVALAEVEAPKFLFPVRRGAVPQWEYHFQDAMRSYPMHDYVRTIEALRPVVDTWPEVDAPRFFLGACELMAGRAKDAIRELRVTASGGSSFAEEARFYLAHAYLEDGRSVEVLQVLQQLVKAEGEFSGRARELLGICNLAKLYLHHQPAIYRVSRPHLASMQIDSPLRNRQP